MFVAQVLAENGRFGGDIQKILDADGSIVIDTFHYINYVNERKYVEFMLNRKN